MPLTFSTNRNGSVSINNFDPATFLATLPVTIGTGDGLRDTPANLWIKHGTASSPVTVGDTPTVQISRTESIVDGTSAGDGSDAAALAIDTTSDNTQQLNAFKAHATMNGANDCVGVYGVGDHFGTANQSKIGYGGYFVAGAHTQGNSAVSVGTAVFNATGVDETWGTGVNSLGIDLVAQGINNLVAGGSKLRASGGAQFDVGHGAEAGSVKNTFLQDDSSSVTILKSASSHTNGVNLAGATFSGSPILAPLMTPASSAATGTQGAIKWDANFIYICTSTNTWKRVALSTF